EPAVSFVAQREAGNRAAVVERERLRRNEVMRLDEADLAGRELQRFWQGIVHATERPRALWRIVQHRSMAGGSWRGAGQPSCAATRSAGNPLAKRGRKPFLAPCIKSLGSSTSAPNTLRLSPAASANAPF